MPQLSIETYVTQYFWLIVILGIFYYYISTQIVPKIGEIKKTRARIAAESLSTEKRSNTSETKKIEIGVLDSTNKMGEKGKKISEILENMNKNWVST